MHFATAYFILYSLVNQASSSPEVERISYKYAQVWRTEHRNPRDVLLFKKLMDDQDISIWKLSPTSTDYLVRPDNKVKVNRQLASRKLNHTVVIMDVQRRVDAQYPQQPIEWTEDSLRVGHRLNWKMYPTLKVINEYFNFLSENYPSICKVKTIGYTAENRTITMLTITNGNPANKAILLTSGMHAREWVGITSALYVLNEIATNFDDLPAFMKNKEWNIIPLLNPDGYRYSHDVDRLWRKNRRKFGSCYGVDINRNFEIDWGIAGITENGQCKEAYAGPFPFSEPESIVLRDVVQTSKRIKALLDLHSYGQLILYPWGAKTSHTKDVKALNATASGMSEAMYNATKYSYKFGSTIRTIYPATGTGLDWIYNAGVTQTFAIEARDLGKHGFLLPPMYIEDTGKELFVAAKYLAHRLESDLVYRAMDSDVSWF